MLTGVYLGSRLGSSGTYRSGTAFCSVGVCTASPSIEAGSSGLLAKNRQSWATCRLRGRRASPVCPVQSCLVLRSQGDNT